MKHKVAWFGENSTQIYYMLQKGNFFEKLYQDLFGVASMLHH